MLHLHRDTWRILLIDQDPFKQNLRATVLRNYQVEVDLAASGREAESLWTNNLYDLVLLAAAEDSIEALTLTEQIRSLKPRQRIALLVGAPTYLREIGGIPRRVARKPVTAPSSFAPEFIGESGLPPQWQEMIQRMVLRSQ